jgi:GT2 family glycosyltransferase
MDYSVCIVLHNSKPELAMLLDSIDACPGPRPQIICADSGSSDGGGDFALERGAELVSMEGNVGFGAANNAALEMAIHPVSILLNPDCRVSGDNLARLAVTAAAQRSLVAPRLLNADGTLQESAHPVPGGLDGYLASLTMPRLLGPRLGTHLQPFRSTEPTTVGWAIGACIAARTELFRALGPFNPADFLFSEDLDLCLRARAQGVATIFDPTIEIFHSGAHTSEGGVDQERIQLQALRRREVILNQLGRGALARDDRSQWLTFKVRAMLGRDRALNECRAGAVRKAQKSPS